MVEGKLYKTKLCVLYQKGRCTRHSCNFAHGNAELRGNSPPFGDERHHQGGDLRGRVDKWNSPPRRGWEERDQRAYMGHAPSTSLEKSQRKRKFEHREEFSGNARFSLQSDHRARDGSFRALSSKSNLDDELKQVQSDVNKLEARKAQIQHFLEERDKEVDALSFRLKELEAQLHEEREESHRVASKIKKFVKEHNRHSRIQDELKRSHARLHKLGVQLGSHISSSSAHGDDRAVDALSEDEGGNQLLNSGKGRDNLASLSKREVSIDLNIVPGANLHARLLNDERQVEAAKSVRYSQQSRQSSLAHREKGAVNVKNGTYASVRENEKVMSAVSHSQHRTSDAGHLLPATGMAAHAGDEGADLLGIKKVLAVESGSGANIYGSEYAAKVQLPPPPPVMVNNLKNKVSEDTLDEDTVHVDIV